MKKFSTMSSQMDGEKFAFNEKDALTLANGDIEYMRVIKQKTKKDWGTIVEEFEKKHGLDKDTLSKTPEEQQRRWKSTSGNISAIENEVKVPSKKKASRKPEPPLQ